MTNKIEIGSPVRLVEAHEHLPAGTVGFANSVVHVDKTYIWFMPSTEFEIYILDAERFELIPDEEVKSMGFDALIPEIPEDLSDVVSKDKDDIIEYTNM